MGIGVGIFLFAIGAILKFAVNVHSSDVNLSNVGVILMLVGGVGILLSMMFWSSWGGFGGQRRSTVVTASDPRYDYDSNGRRIVREEYVERF